MKKLLFVCTGNSHRSILAESVVNKFHKNKFIGYSAGSKPSGIINKYVIKYLNENNFDTKNLSSKNFNKFLNEKTTFDQVFTVCNNASNEVCPVWPSPEKIVHWDIEDPVYIINELEKSDKPNKEELISTEIHKTYSNLETRINDWIKIMKYSKFFLGEFIGSCFLVMIIVGSGIMAENLTNDTGIMLLANTIATGAGLFVLITVFSDVSGAHFNPFVSLAMFLTKKLKGNLLPTYISAQILGCLLGVALANFFFEHQIFELSTKSRDGINIFTSEIVATFGLILIIFGSLKKGSVVVASCVAFYITAGYWFTSSTSFANPAVAIARTFTESFTGINYMYTPVYILAEIIGALFAVFVAKKMLFNNRTRDKTIS